MQIRGSAGEVILLLVYKSLLFQGRSIGELGGIVNYHHSHIRMMPWSNLDKSKKMSVVSLWNDLPWLHNDFQVGKV
jgi:hypothetical protein